MKRSGQKGFGMLALFLITGAVLGGIIGQLIAGSSLLAGFTPYLVKTYTIFDISPVTFNLYILELTVGLKLQPNLISILGVLAAIFLFKKF